MGWFKSIDDLVNTRGAIKKVGKYVLYGGLVGMGLMLVGGVIHDLVTLRDGLPLDYEGTVGKWYRAGLLTGGYCVGPLTGLITSLKK